MAVRARQYAELKRLVTELESQPPGRLALNAVFAEYPDKKRVFSPDLVQSYITASSDFLRAFHVTVQEAGDSDKNIAAIRKKMTRVAVMGRNKMAAFFESLKVEGENKVVDVLTMRDKYNGAPAAASASAANTKKRAVPSKGDGEEGDDGSASASGQPPSKRHRQVVSEEKDPKTMTKAALNAELKSKGFRVPTSLSHYFDVEFRHPDNTDWEAHWKKYQAARRAVLNAELLRKVRVLRQFPEPDESEHRFAGMCLLYEGVYMENTSMQPWLIRLAAHGAEVISKIITPEERSRVTHILRPAPITSRARDAWFTILYGNTEDATDQTNATKTFKRFEHMNEVARMILGDAVPVVLFDWTMPAFHELETAFSDAAARVAGAPGFPPSAFETDPSLVAKRARDLLPPACYTDTDATDFETTGFRSLLAESAEDGDDSEEA